MKKDFFQNKQEKIRRNKKGLVLIDFFSSWSAPCDTQASILEELALSSKDIVDIVKVDMDEPDNNPDSYNISALPTLCLLKDGIEVKRFIGVQPLDTLLKEIKIQNS